MVKQVRPTHIRNPDAKCAAEQTRGWVDHMLDISQANGIFIMINRKQSLRHSMAEIHWGNAFRAQLIGAIPATPVVISRRVVGPSGRIKAIRTPHWLSGFVTSPAAVAAPQKVGPADDRA